MERTEYPAVEELIEIARLKPKKRADEKGRLQYENRYLNPTEFCEIPFGAIEAEVYELLQRIIVFEEVELKDRIENFMTYQDFLNTHFWRIVSLWKKHSSGSKCALCGRTKQLHVHHNTYEHLGSEIFHLNDLVVLCQDCHEYFHKGGRL